MIYLYALIAALAVCIFVLAILILHTRIAMVEFMIEIRIIMDQLAGTSPDKEEYLFRNEDLNKFILEYMGRPEKNRK